MQELLQKIHDVEMPNVFNPWRQADVLDWIDGDGGPSKRVERLRSHFDCSPRFLLVGEAPGYQGCKFSGVPFTNERLLVSGTVPRIKLNARITTRFKTWSEPSATIVWRTLHDLGIAADVVMWNAFAWHPHKPGNPYSNRTPTLSELFAGSDVLKAVVKHFAAARLIAVGNKARDLLANLGFYHAAHVRHPSMGGAKEFRDGMTKLVAGKEQTHAGT